MPRLQAEFFENHRHRAKPGNRRLQKISSDEGRKIEPVGAMDLGQNYT